MKDKKILWAAVMAISSFIVIFWRWQQAPIEKSLPKQVVERQKTMSEPALEKSGAEELNLVLKPEELEELSAHEEFMHELEMLEAERRIEAEQCSSGIEQALKNKEYIDPRSEFYRDLDKLSHLSHYTAHTMAATGPSEEMSWLVEDYLDSHTPPNISALIERHHDLQETCLISSGITLMQTLIDSCSYNCSPRLKNLIGNLVFDGLLLVMGNYSGVERIMLSLSIMEKVNRLGPFYISFNNEIEDFRFRAQHNYELFREELQLYENKPERLRLAFQTYIEENKLLKEEIENLLENSAKRYFP